MERDSKGRFIKGTNGETYDGFGIWYDKKGYPTIWINGKNIKLHVYIWEKVNGEKPEGFDIHHKDFDKRNYSIDNLELLTKSDHLRIHARWVREKGIWIKKPCSKCNQVLPLDNFYKRKTVGTHNGLCKVCHNKESKKYQEKNKEKRKEYMKGYYELNKKEKWGIKS